MKNEQNTSFRVRRQLKTSLYTVCTMISTVFVLVNIFICIQWLHLIIGSSIIETGRNFLYKIQMCCVFIWSECQYYPIIVLSIRGQIWHKKRGVNITLFCYFFMFKCSTIFSSNFRYTSSASLTVWLYKNFGLWASLPKSVLHPYCFTIFQNSRLG